MENTNVKSSREILIDGIQEKIGENVLISKAVLRLILTAMTEVIKDELDKGNVVKFKDFGTFEVREYKQTYRRNPQNRDEVITVPARFTPVFRAGKGLKTRVRSNIVQ